MEVRDQRIDQGHAFDWGKTSLDYAKYRDIYPAELFQKIAQKNLCVAGQNVLDLGTGTGVLPRAMYQYGAHFVGIDSSKEQIEAARSLSLQNGMDIEYKVAAAEELSFDENSFDVVTACQCFFYFNPEIVVPKIAGVLKRGGHLVILYMAWLPEEDCIGKASEDLILKYNPTWTGNGERRHPVELPKQIEGYFEKEYATEFDLTIPFTRESWNGRIKACRGIGATLSEEKIRQWETEHNKLLERIAPQQFSVLHYAAISILRRA